VNAVLGECIWNLSYSERRMAIELELTVTLDDDAISNLLLPVPHHCRLRRLGRKRIKIRVLHLVKETFLFIFQIINPTSAKISDFCVFV
jgi:hypothetical protein